jgi:hypothetical protein
LNVIKKHLFDRMHKSPRGFGYASDSSRMKRQRTRGAQAQLAGDRPRLPSATSTLRRRPTPPPLPPRPTARLGTVPPGTGRGRLRPGREQAFVTAPGHSVVSCAARPGRGRLQSGRERASVTAPSCSRGRARCHPPGPAAPGGMGSNYTTATNTGRRASPVRPVP